MNPVMQQAQGNLLIKDRKSTRLNSSHGYISYAVFCLKKKKNHTLQQPSSKSAPTLIHTPRVTIAHLISCSLNNPADTTPVLRHPVEYTLRRRASPQA